MIFELSAAELARQLARKELSCAEVASHFADRIEAGDADLGCFLARDRKALMVQAEVAQGMIDRGEAGPLTGVPIAIKDNICTEGLATTCASKILEGFVPPYDATVVAKLKSAGLPILGKTNLDEFAMGASTETSAFQITRNPVDPTRSPGGSSGGSAAAVAARFAPLALGSDTGGSIRQPAALCGVAGFKPTYGRCSRFGLVAFASSLDQIGPIARTVEDIALLSELITGHDPLDSTSQSRPPISSALGEGSMRGLRIGLPSEMFSESPVSNVVRSAVERLRREGAEIVELSLPAIALGVSTYYILAPAEASSNLARFDGIRYGRRVKGKGHVGMVERTRGEGFGHEVKARIMIGTYALSAGYYDAFYLRAQQVRQWMISQFRDAFERVDVMMSPTSPITAFKLGELKDDPLALKLLDFCTIPANLIGAPAISINCGFVPAEGAQPLPVGLQIMAPPFQDERLLQIAYCVEKVLMHAT